MSWYDSLWPYRQPVSVVNTLGAGTIDIIITFPPYWDLFWDNVLASGDDIWITEADGRTPISATNATALNKVAFSKAARTGQIEIKAYTGAVATTNTAQQFFVYWGNAAAAAQDFGAGVMASPQDGRVETRGASSFPKTVVTSPPTFGTDVPTDTFQKGTKEIVEIAWDFSAELAQSETKSKGKFVFEEIRNADIDAGVRDTSIPALIDQTKTRFLDPLSHVVLGHYRGGQDGKDYWLECTITSDLGLKLQRRILMRVRDPKETTLTS